MGGGCACGADPSQEQGRCGQDPLRPCLGKEPNGYDPEPGHLPVGDQRPSSRLRGRCLASSPSASSCLSLLWRFKMKRPAAAISFAASLVLATSINAAAQTSHPSNAQRALQWLQCTQQQSNGQIGSGGNPTAPPSEVPAGPAAPRLDGTGAPGRAV